MKIFNPGNDDEHIEGVDKFTPYKEWDGVESDDVQAENNEKWYFWLGLFGGLMLGLAASPFLNLIFKLGV